METGDTQKINKIIFLGDTATGKSSFLKNYLSNTRTKASIPTEGFECLTAIQINPRRYVQLWDTPGQEKYRMFPQAIIGQFDYALVFFDLTSRHTFEIAKTIGLNAVKYYKNLRVSLLGNKLDIVRANPGKREVEYSQAEHSANVIGGMYYQYSFQDRADKVIQKLFEYTYKEPSLGVTKLEVQKQAECSCAR